MLQVVLLALLATLIVFVIRQGRVVFAEKLSKSTQSSSDLLTAPAVGPNCPRQSGMRTRFMAHVMAAVVISLLWWAGGSLYESALKEVGKQAFLARQAERFERMALRGGWSVTGCASAFGFVGVGLATYEIVAMAIFAAIRSKEDSGAA